MPIAIREPLYFNRPTTVTTYSDIPNESPEISRLLNGQKPFPSADTAMQKLPKKIIVDLDIRYALNRSKQKAFDRRIQELQDEGLSVYYYHNDQLSDYDVAIIDNVTVPNNLPRTAQLSQILGIPVDEFYVINNAIAPLVISGFDAESPDYLSEVVSLRNKEKIRSVIINSNQPLSEIDAFISEFPTVKHLFLETTSYEELLDLKSYSNLFALETIDLDLSGSDITSAQLARILAGLNIHVLKLNRCKNIKDTFPEGINISELKELELSTSSITSISLARIVKQAFNLQVLKLHRCANLNEPFPEDLSFPALEELEISGGHPHDDSISGASLANLLAHTQKLKILNLINYRNIKDVRLPDGLKFPELEEINFRAHLISNYSVTMEVLTDFLSRSPNIRRLDLEMCAQIEGDLPDGLDFSHLEEINLLLSSLSRLSIYKILTQAKGLKKLHMELIRSYGDMPILCLPLLEDLNLDFSHISTEALTGLLLNGRHLKYLALSSCQNIQEAVSNDASFPELEVLNLNNSSITGEALYKILKTTHQLKKLNLSYCKNIDDTLPHYLNLPELEELDLINSTITNESLLKLIAKSPKLKRLKLYGCNNLDTTVIAGLQRAGLEIELPDEKHDDMHERMPPKRHSFFEDDEEKSSKASPSTFLPATYNAKSQKSSVDADTRITAQTFKVERIFMGKPTSPDPRDLRYETFDGFSLNERGGMKEPFILHNMASELSSSDYISKNCQATQPLYKAYSKSTERHYFCRTDLQLTRDWQGLPSAFADEELEQFYIKPSADVELAKSTRTNLYYIRLKNSTAGPQAVTFEMLLTRQKPVVTFANLPENVCNLAKFCRGFREEALKSIAPNATAQEFLDALIQERAGACRHRSIVFMHLMQKQYPAIPVRLVSNAVHMFVEVNYNGSWVACDLGGYPANVQVNERGLPEYQPGEQLESDPMEVYAETLSDTGQRTLAPDFFEKARNLTKLTLKDCSHLPLHCDLSMLDTLNMENSPLTAEGLQKLLMLALNIKTLIIKNCTLTPEEFNRLDFSCLKYLEHISLSGRFIPDMESVTRLMQTAPQARWIIESDNFSLEDTKPMVDAEKSTPRANMEIRKKPRQLPSRYFASRNRHLTAKKQAFEILKPSGQSTSIRKTLVNAGDAESARLGLQKTATSLGQLHYYIDSPDALRCAGPYIRREGHLGHIENKAGGPLYDFIVSNPGTPKNIIIDYNAFKMSDFASFNSLLDDPPTLDDITLPPDIHIIGLLNQNNPDAYQGADFYSRFDAFEPMFCAEHWPALKPIPLTDKLATTEIIELCGGEQWEARLIGHWLLQEGRLIFKEGLLLEALKARKSSFSFNHAPLHDPKFVRFLHDLTLQGRIVHQGHDYGPLPDDFNVVLTAGVHIPEKERLLTIPSKGALTPNHVMLNQANLSDFLGRYLLDETTHQLSFQEGLIEQHKNNVLPIYLTSSLSFYTWLKLLEACRKYQTVLEVTLAPDVTFPAELAIYTAPVINKPILTPTSNTAFNPPELPENPAMIIDVGELKPDELLATFKCNGFNATSHQFEFTPIKICPWEALKAGKTVVLKGEWTQEVADAVQTIMFKRMQQDNPPGKLIVFSKTPKQFNAFPEIPIPDAMQVAPKTLDQLVDYENRFEAVTAALKDHPFVLLTGATGIGKTHFVSRTWKAAHPACYYGEKQIISFLESISSDGLITLYINEANLSNKDWSMFEGLFDEPPAIFYNNHYYPITPRHKIIFDGNPISYGGERHTPRLFQHHPYQLHFKPLPRDVLSSMTGLDRSLSTPILEVVMYMATLNPNDTLLTPREIKMMGAFVKTSMSKYPHILPEILARYFAYTLCKNHVPRSFQTEFETLFKVDSPFQIADIATPTREGSEHHDKKHDYLLNNTNLPPAIALEGHLMVREDRRKQISPQSLEIGLGGLVIEGASGEGKSQLILNQLAAHGYKKDIDFIHIPAKSKPNEIKEKLSKSFHEGLIVVIDEMNSLPMPEQLLNALLEGHDLEDNPPKKPGFLLLGTQNPISYRGRLKTTSPLEHRLQKVDLPTSTLLEKNRILEKMGLPSRIAQDIIGEYSQRSDLTFRDVIKISKQWLKHHQHQPSIQLDITPVKQVGSLCKTVAIANVENYYAKKMDYDSIPLWSEQQETISIRKLAKANGSSQGEILEFEQWRKTLDDLGFTSEQVDFHENMSHFVATITDNLKQGNLPLIAFPVDRDSGLLNPETKEPEDTEHAAVISGYNWQTDELTLVHWGKTHVVDATTLFNDTGFKAKLLIVQVPDEEFLLQKREKLAHKLKEEQTSIFKEVYRKLFRDKPDSSQSNFTPKK